MLQPKRTKYRKPFKVRYDGKAKRGTTIEFGHYAIQATTAGWVDARQIEATRKAVVRHLKRGGKLWIRIFPHNPLTKKPLEVRMGKGKGSVDKYVAVVKPGMILFEVDFPIEEQALEALRLGQHKLPVKCRLVKKGDENE